MWKFIKSSTNNTNWLKGHAKEVCFIGRSNVGKSSLINSIAKSKVARTSNTPGRTQMINFFEEENKIYVDLPGYGYAKMSKDKKKIMLNMIEEYLSTRREIVRIFILIDSKVGPTKDDINMINYLKELEKEYFIILTKSDKPNQKEKYKTIQKIKKIADDYLDVSSLKRTNIAKLEKIINNSFK